MLLRYSTYVRTIWLFQRVDGGPRVEAFSARQHVRQADIRWCRRFHDPSQHSRRTDEQTARPTRCNCWTGLRTDGRLSAQVLHTESGGPGRRCSARHRSSKAVVESSAATIGRISIKGVKWEWSAREPSAAGAGRVSTVSVLHGVHHHGYLWEEDAQRVDDESMGC